MHLLSGTTLLSVFGLANAAYNLTSPLQGCSQVTCPSNGRCVIEKQTYTQLGVTNFTRQDSADPPFNWIVAGNTDSSKGQQGYDKNFFLGTPEDLL